MIDRRELLEKARERNLTLGMIEKDYVLGWLLFGISEINDLTFKGGTALSKIYFPRIWRLSEDLDFERKGLMAGGCQPTWQGLWRAKS